MKIVFVQESYPNHSKYALLLIILALLINFLLLFVLFIIQTDHTFFTFTKKQPEEEAPVVFEQMPEPPPPSLFKEVAALKPGASNLGTPDDYQEDYMVAQVANNQNIDAKPEEPINNDQPQEEPQTSQQEEQGQTHLIKQVIPEKPKQPEPPQPAQQQEQQKIKAPLKKELTFNDIAKGFLSSIDQGGNDLVERKGNENIRPDFEEMRILSYQHKIFWYIQNEWKRINLTLNHPVPPFVVTGISMTIDKDGNLEDVTITHSCGVHQLDEAIVQGIRAASPFPPLPTFLKKDRYTFDFGVKHVQNNQNGFNRHY